MSGLEIKQVLSQMRVMQAQAQSSNTVAETQQGSAADFSSLLKQSIDTVNGLQKNSGSLQEQYVRGEGNVNLSDVMLASQKSGVAFQAAVEVRNKLIEAYKEVKNIQV